MVYEDGWTVKVDGEKVGTKKVGGAMLAFDITKGKHTIEMSYIPKGFVLGTSASLLGLVMLIMAAFLYRGYLKKTFIFRYKTHPNANPDRFDDESDVVDITAFTECKTSEKYMTTEPPIVARIVLSVVFSLAYFAVWLGGIIKKVKTLIQQDPTYTFDVLLSLIVPFYFVYAVYKYSKITEKVAAQQKLRVTSTFTHATLEFASSCGFFVALVTVISTLSENFNTYISEVKSNASLIQNGGTPIDHTVSLFPTGMSLAVLIFCVIAGIAIRITNLYLFDQDILQIAKRKYNS